jgi:hypothetical protein
MGSNAQWLPAHHLRWSASRAAIGVFVGMSFVMEC